MNPIGSLLAIIPVSYLGGRLAANKPRWIACGMLALGLGSLGRSSHTIQAGYIQKTRQRSSMLVGGQHLCNSLPR